MKDLTDLVIIIDKSESMHGLEKDVVGGFNALIEEQKKDGDVEVTAVFFNDKVSFIYENEKISEVKKLDERKYQPSGCTALLDAIGDAISFIKAKHAKLKENELPEHTIFSIMTDGLENASIEYSYKRIKEMIELQKKCGWEFIFQAANIDTAIEAEQLGINPGMSFDFAATEKGVKRAMKCCSATIRKIKQTNYRKSK